MLGFLYVLFHPRLVILRCRRRCIGPRIPPGIGLPQFRGDPALRSGTIGRFKQFLDVWHPALVQNQFRRLFPLPLHGTEHISEARFSPGNRVSRSLRKLIIHCARV